MHVKATAKCIATGPGKPDEGVRRGSGDPPSVGVGGGYRTLEKAVATPAAGTATQLSGNSAATELRACVSAELIRIHNYYADLLHRGPVQSYIDTRAASATDLQKPFEKIEAGRRARFLAELA